MRHFFFDGECLQQAEWYIRGDNYQGKFDGWFNTKNIADSKYDEWNRSPGINQTMSEPVRVPGISFMVAKEYRPYFNKKTEYIFGVNCSFNENAMAIPLHPKQKEEKYCFIFYGMRSRMQHGMVFNSLVTKLGPYQWIKIVNESLRIEYTLINWKFITKDEYENFLLAGLNEYKNDTH